MRIRPCAAAAALLLFLGTEAGAQEGEPGGGPEAAEAAPAPPVPRREAGTSFEDSRVETQAGWVVWYYSVNFVDPRVLKDELSHWKSAEAKIEPMTAPPGPKGEPAVSLNVLRIQEKRENLPLLEKMLEILDQPQPQVLVTAKLVEVTYSGKLEWGFEHAYTAPGETFFRSTSFVFNPDSYLNSSATRPFQGGSFRFAFVGESQSNYGTLDSVIRLLKSRGKAEILGEPNILATQGKQARVKAGEKVPIQTANYQGNNVAITTSFENTGIELTITPELIGKDAVRLNLKETFSAVTGFVEGQAGTKNPIINSREAETTLTVRDGATLVVGGLQSSRLIEEEKGIPLLMDIPLLGWLFSTKSKEEVKTELYFIATPRIILGSYSEGLVQPPGERERLDSLRD